MMTALALFSIILISPDSTFLEAGSHLYYELWMAGVKNHEYMKRLMHSLESV